MSPFNVKHGRKGFGKFFGHHMHGDRRLPNLRHGGHSTPFKPAGHNARERNKVIGDVQRKAMPGDSSVDPCAD
jgi:hypothetical protein